MCGFFFDESSEIFGFSENEVAFSKDGDFCSVTEKPDVPAFYRRFEIFVFHKERAVFEDRFAVKNNRIGMI